MNSIRVPDSSSCDDVSSRLFRNQSPFYRFHCFRIWRRNRNCRRRLGVIIASSAAADFPLMDDDNDWRRQQNRHSWTRLEQIFFRIYTSFIILFSSCCLNRFHLFLTCVKLRTGLVSPCYITLHWNVAISWAVFFSYCLPKFKIHNFQDFANFFLIG